MTPTLQLYLAAMKPTFSPLEGDENKGHKTSIMYEVDSGGEALNDGSHYLGFTFVRLYVEDECIYIVYWIESEDENLDEMNIETRIPMSEASLDGVVYWINSHCQEAGEAAETLYPGVEQRSRNYSKKRLGL